MTVQQHQLTIDGIPLNYTEAGNGNHVVMLCCGQFGFADLDFGPIIRQMDQTAFRIICCDPPGYGKSRPYDRDFGWESNFKKDAELFLKLLHVLGIQKSSLVGWSIGGTTAQMMIDMEPDRFNRLVFWGSYYTFEPGFYKFAKILSNLNSWPLKQREPMIAAYGQEYFEKMLKNWGAAADCQFQELRGMPLVPAKNIQCPTLILHGERDAVGNVEQARRWHSEIKNSRIYLMPHAGHNLHLTDTDEFLDVVESFLKEQVDQN